MRCKESTTEMELFHKQTLREKCPKRSFFCSALSVSWTEYGDLGLISVFSPSTGKYGPEKTSRLDTFYVIKVSCLKQRFLESHPEKSAYLCYYYYVWKCRNIHPVSFLFIQFALKIFVRCQVNFSFLC